MSDQWNLKCPACKTDRWVRADELPSEVAERGTMLPRLEPGMCVCVDCGCVFVALLPGQRKYLLDVIIAKRKAAG